MKMKTKGWKARFGLHEPLVMLCIDEDEMVEQKIKIRVK